MISPTQHKMAEQLQYRQPPSFGDTPQLKTTLDTHTHPLLAVCVSSIPLPSEASSKHASLNANLPPPSGAHQPFFQRDKHRTQKPTPASLTSADNPMPENPCFPSTNYQQL